MTTLNQQSSSYDSNIFLNYLLRDELWAVKGGILFNNLYMISIISIINLYVKFIKYNIYKNGLTFKFTLLIEIIINYDFRFGGI